MILRSYQNEAVEALLRAEPHALCVLPTGSGKTEIFIEILKRTTGNTLIVLNRLSLFDQTVRRIRLACPRETIRVYCGSRNKQNHAARITIGLIQSLSRYQEPFNQIILDECHALSDRYFHLLSKHPRAKIYGFTATPYRANGTIFGANKLFDKIHYRVPLDVMIRDGYLVPPKTKGSAVSFDTSKLRVRAGEYRQDDLDALVSDKNQVEAQVKDALERLNGRKKAIWFCCNIKHAELVAAMLPEASLLHSKLSDDEREEAQFKFEVGENRHLVFVTIVSEGWDFPPTDAVVMMRPTRSPVLYVQVCGRALRPSAGKEDALILDYGRVIETLGPLNNPRITTATGKREVVASNPTGEKMCPSCFSFIPVGALVCPECDFQFQMDKLLMKPDEKSNILQISPILSRPVTRIEVSEVTSKNGNPCLRFIYGDIFPLTETMILTGWNLPVIRLHCKDLGIPSVPGIYKVDLTIHYEKTDYGIRLKRVERERARTSDSKMA